jgi:competence protein ComEC
MNKNLTRAVTATVIGIILAGVHWSRLPHGKLVVNFLDIGQGDAILLSLPTGEHVLVDGGPEQLVLEELGEVMPFLDRKIDLMVLTHPHADHIMGLVQVLKRYEVEEVLLSGVNYWSSIYDEFLREIRRQNIPTQVAQADDDFSIGSVNFDILFPFESMLGDNLSNLNNGSVIMKIIYKDQSLLLTGDAEIEVEEALVEAHDRGDIDLRADVLKSGHHGSRTASSWEFLERVQPTTAVIQSGVDNSFGHPHEETLTSYFRMGLTVHRNDLSGRIQLTF